MPRYRSSQDFAQTYAGNKKGFAISIENFVHIKEETVPGVLQRPAIGTQALSTSAATPSADITASANRKGRIQLDQGPVVEFTLAAVAGLNTGVLIAAALELAINTAQSLAGLDSRVWVEYSTTRYKVYSQKTSTLSKVVITNGSSLDLMVELKLGVGNAGTEILGTAGGDFLFMTKASMKVGQSFEMSEHRSGRQASNIIKNKKMADGEVEMYFNAGRSGTAEIDPATALLLESAIGKKTVSGGTVLFDASQANSKYFSVIQGNNAFGRQFNGAYAKSFTISLPGDGAAKMSIPVKARDGKYAGIGQVNGVVAAASAVVLNAGEAPNFEVLSRVMIVKADGRTVTFGADGTLTLLSRIDGSHTLNLSAPVDCDDDGYVVPWLPHCFDQVGLDNPITGLQGTVSFDGGATQIEEIRSVEFMFDPKTEDFDNWYGADGNRGFVVADKADINVKVELVLSSSQVQKIVQSKEFYTFAMQVKLGDTSQAYFQFDCPKVYFEVPDVEIPDSGSLVITLNGKAVQTQSGALDAFQVRYKSAVV